MRDVEQSLLMKALRREKVSRTPAWVMRQAGRYLPEYRQLRKKAGSFLSLCKTKELALEATLQPLRRFPLDAAILFSDILTIPDAMGLGLYFVEGEGPCFRSPLKTEKQIEMVVKQGLVESLSYVTDTVSLLARALPNDLPLIGFSGSPWTLACYMVEGKSSRTFPEMMHLLSRSPLVLRLLLDSLASIIGSYLSSQIESGADIVMLFDTWGGLLSEKDFLTYSLPYLQKIRQILKENHPKVPAILFVKGGSKWLQPMVEAGFDALSLDASISLDSARTLTKNRVALQGNLDPNILLTDRETIEREVARVLASYGNGSGHIFNLAHGITPDVPPEHVSVMLEAISTKSIKYHQNFS